MKMNSNTKEKLKIGAGIIIVALFLVGVWQVYVPVPLEQDQEAVYNIEKGMSTGEIASELKKQGVIRSSFFFNLYAFLSGQRAKLQAGLYEFSTSISIAGIVHKLASGDIATNKVRINAGWNAKDIGKYLESKSIYPKRDFDSAIAADFSKEFSFLKDKPKNVGLEGYIFPDTYKIPAGVSAEDFVRMALNDFDKKLTPELRKEIAARKKTIFQIVTMASILEKEVRSLEDKKIVAGILWKRMENGMPLQVDCTINYITGKSDAAAKSEDKKIDSPYNTYKYKGLPKGPIASPGINSIAAAIYPKDTAYWYYLSAGKDKTVYSKNFTEHTSAIVKYFY